MSDEKISELSALSGSNLANGDLFPVVDVSDTTMSPDGTNFYITADELAQGSQFSSRYAKAANAVVWLPAQSAVPSVGSPSLGRVNGRTPCYLMDQSTNEQINWAWAVPTDWVTMSVELWWSNAGAGSGNVVYELRGSEDGDAETPTDVAGLAAGAALTAPAQDVIKKSVLVASYTLGGDYMGHLRINRLAADAGDTLANDAAYIGIMLRRLT